MGASLVALLVGCTETGGRVSASQAQSCMTCHNGSHIDNYSGPGIENPHPFVGADNLSCTTCHGGDPNNNDKSGSHVPPPPQIGDRNYQLQNRTAFFNKLTLTGLDKYADYTANGQTYTALDYLQFVNPGDLRVTTQGRACGQCHSAHSTSVNMSLLATEAGILGGAIAAIGVDNHLVPHQNLFEDTAADVAFRAVSDPNHTHDPNVIGKIGQLIEFPVFSRRVETGNNIFRNDDYLAAALDTDLEADRQVKSDSSLARLYHEQIAFTCGDCHLGSSGANNRTGDYRSSGCTACHMPYSFDGRSRSGDPNVNKQEPIDPDDLDPPERPHLRSHQIVSVAKTMANGHIMQGIDDYACAGCHQGSNRTVMQYWGIRLDQNEDLRFGFQYPAMPDSFQNTNGDTRLFDPIVRNNEFNGRDRNQYILFEDYDGDGRDDTPADVHYDAGMGCIDCHGSYDLHGNVNNPEMWSRMSQSVAIRCESCHGSADTYAATKLGPNYSGTTQELAMDAKGNVLPHVYRDGTDGHYYMVSKLTGKKHFVFQTRDAVVDTARTHPFTSAPLYSKKASYAMGRNDGLTSTGIGPRQTADTPGGFSHTDNMDCASCHASWTNSCIGCHLEGEYDGGNNFSNVTGERIIFREKFAEFVYQSPVFMTLGVNSRNKITQVAANTKMFFRYEDRNNNRSKVFAFSDRTAKGNNPTNSFASLGHNAMLAHSIRGRVSQSDEGPRYCVACHLTTTGLATHGTAYNAYRSIMQSNTFASLDYNLLRDHIGKNTGNQINSPMWVHMVAGLGTGLFLFDENGCPVNPLDTNDNRFGCEGVAPATLYDPARAFFNLDRIVLDNGTATASSNHPLLFPGGGPNLRTGAQNIRMSGPLGSTLVDRLTNPTTGIILNSWLDANSTPQGGAGAFVN